MIIETTNDGPFLRASTYWGSPLEQAGKIWCSVNAGCIRILVPRTERRLIRECQSARYAIVSRGPWPAEGLDDAVEILWEDGSNEPYSLHLAPNSFDVLPAEPEPGRGWEIAIWDYRRGRPHMALRRPCHWRRVPQLPWLKPLTRRKS